MEKFFTGLFETALSPQEILIAVRIPRRSKAARFGYWKFCRKAGEFPQAIGGALTDPERKETRAVIGATSGAPKLFLDLNPARRGHRRHRQRRLLPPAPRRRAAPRDRTACRMSKITLTVNGRPVTAEVEPRTHLADFLREQQSLTGTNLGCEHGVCGACTIEIDGAPARSCIAYAAACDGAAVRTIEGFDDDPVMAQLREAFTAEHALQCGYCTPGMLVTARDIVTRRAECG